MTPLFLTAMAVIAAALALWASTEVNDTTSTTINGQDGTADFTIDDGSDNIHYKCILDTVRLREQVEMTRADTFCIEGSSDQEPGVSTLFCEISGVGKKGGPASGPLIPAPQNVIIKATFSTGCFLTMTVNFSEATADRLVNQNMRIGGRCQNKGAYVLTWDRGS